MPKARRQKASDPSPILYTTLGAGRQVTGSLHFFEIPNGKNPIRFFCDFGLDQERPSPADHNRLPPGVKMSSVLFGIVSHPHLDHVGDIPWAVKNGFTGKIYTSRAARDLCGVLLPDSGYLQEEAAKRATKKNVRRCNDAAEAKRKVKGCDEDDINIEARYTEAEAIASLKQFEAVEFDKPLKIRDGITIKFTSASHLLGAAVVTLELGEGAQKRRVVFTGDLGRPDMPLLKDVAPIKHADYLICEGTYGTRKHVKRNRLAALAEILNKAYERANVVDPVTGGHGVIIMPAFAVGRVQAALYDVNQLIRKKKIPNMPVFVDSPMAIKATAIHRAYPELYNAKAAKLLASGGDLFSPPRFAELPNWQDSVLLDQPAKEPTLIIGSSGMAAGGRIVRHLENRLSGANNTAIFIGFQGAATLGRQIVTPGIKEVRIQNRMIPVRATIVHMGDYSGHADVDDIMRFLKGFDSKPRKMFLVHGEEEALLGLQEHIKKELGWDVEVPRLRQQFELE